MFHVAGGTGDELFSPFGLDEWNGFFFLYGLTTNARENAAFQKHIVVDFEVFAHIEFTLFLRGWKRKNYSTNYKPR